MWSDLPRLGRMTRCRKTETLLQILDMIWVDDSKFQTKYLINTLTLREISGVGKTNDKPLSSLIIIIIMNKKQVSNIKWMEGEMKEKCLVMHFKCSSL